MSPVNGTCTCGELIQGTTKSRFEQAWQAHARVHPETALRELHMNL